MTSNPYSPPKANVQSSEREPTIPMEVLKKIRNAWIAGVISGCLTLVVTLVAMGGTSILGYSAWELVDVALVFGLTFGIYKKSRTCAILMLVYFAYSKFILLVENPGKTSGIVMAVIFIYFYALGVVGTFQYHKLARAHANSTPRSEG